MGAQQAYRRVRCLAPASCGKTWHLMGTGAALACAQRSGSALDLSALASAPPGDSSGKVFVSERERLAQSFATGLQALEGDLAAADVREGWAPGCGRVHPEGGYDDRTLVVAAASDSPPRNAHYALTYTLAGARHRADGPALVSRPANARTAHASWYAHGELHRGDGPTSPLSPAGGDQGFYHWQGRRVGDDTSVALSRLSGSARLSKLVSFGAEKDTVVAWLAWEKEAGPKDTRALIRAGVDGPTAAQCARAGVVGREQVIAVADGTLPLSWAAAGS